jgi:hypothetical protein
MNPPRSVVRALVNTIMVEAGDTGCGQLTADTAIILEQKIARMPGFARFGMGVLLWVFEWGGLLRTGRRFHRQSPVQRAAQLQRWRDSSLAPCRDLVAFFRRMGTFVWFSLDGAR